MGLSGDGSLGRIGGGLRGHASTGTEQTYTLLQGTGMPATHELAIGWDGSQITFYVDGQPRKSLPTKQMGQWAWLFFDVGTRKANSPAASTMCGSRTRSSSD